MGADGCPQCEKFRQAGLPRCPKCGRVFGASAAKGTDELVLTLRRKGTDTTWRVSSDVRVGRENSDILLSDDQLVSREHAHIRLADGRFLVEDNHSQNGTLVNGREIADPSPIDDGDEITFGDVVLVASIERPQSAPSIASGPDPTVQFEPRAPAPQRPEVRRQPPVVVDAERTILEPPTFPGRSPVVVRPPDPAIRGFKTEPPAPAPAPAPAISPPAKSAAVTPAPVTPAPVSPAAGRPATVTPAAVTPAPVRVTTPGAPVSSPSDAVAQAATVAPVPVRGAEAARPATVAPAPARGDDAAVAEGSGARRLPDLLLAADDLAASIRKFEHDVTTVLQLFEQNGGAPALQSVLAAARRLEANPHSADDLATLVGWLPTACRMLEAEQILVNLMSRVSPRASNASR